MRNERGQAVLGISVFLAILTALIYLYASEKTSRVANIYHSTQAANFTQEIAADLALKLRWAYDAGYAIQTNSANASICGGTTPVAPVLLNGIPLCMPTGKICTSHPARPAYSICIEPGVSLHANYHFNSPVLGESLLALLISPTIAQAGPFSPPNPVPTDTNNILNQDPKCLGGDCEVHCGGPRKNADCFTFRFCPLMMEQFKCADPDDFVWQTVGFLR